MTDLTTTSDRSFILRLLLAAAIIMLPLLTFPMHTDHATFIRGGMALMQGGTLYVDFIDVKPPLIYGIYGIAGTLFGVNPLSVRLFDLLWQLATIFVIVQTLKNFGLSRTARAFTAVIYALLYITLHYPMTGQTETFMALPFAASIWAHSQPRSWKRDAVLGICLASILLFKYTLGIVIPTFIVASWVRRDSATTFLAETARVALATVIALAVLLAPFAISAGFFTGWANVMSYLSAYSSYPPYSIALFREGLKALGEFAGDNISLVVSVAAIIGAASLRSTARTSQQQLLISLCILLIMALLGTVAMERRFWPYHIARIYVPLTMLAGIGASTLWNWYRTHSAPADALSRIALIAGVIAAAIFSPLPRLGAEYVVAAKSLVDPHVYDRYLTRPEHGSVPWGQIRDLERSLASRVQRTDHVMLMSVTAAMIVPFIPSDDISPFCDSHLYFGVGAPEAWRRQALEEMRTSTWVVVDTADVHGLVNLHDRSSFTSLNRDPDFRTTLESSFSLDTMVHSFRIYHRSLQP